MRVVTAIAIEVVIHIAMVDEEKKNEKWQKLMDCNWNVEYEWLLPTE